MLQLLSYSEIFGYNLVLWLWCLMLPFKIYCAHKLFCLSWLYRYCFYSYGSVRQCHTVYCRRTVPQGEELSPSTGCFRSFLSFYWSKSEFSVGDVPSYAVFGRISVVFDISFRREKSCNLPWYFDDLSRRFNVNIFWSKKRCKASIKSTISRFFCFKSVPSLTSIDLISSHIKTQIAKCVWKNYLY